MDKFAVQPEAKPYIDALRSLISTGVHSSLALESSCLLDMAVVAVVNPNISPGIRAETFIAALEQVVASKLQGKDQETGRILFGLGDWAGVSQRDRYEKVAELHNKHWKWDNFRKDPLDQFLMAVYLKLYREGERITSEMPQTASGATPGNESSRQRQSLVSGDYVTNLYDSTFNMPAEPGQPCEFLQVREITATRDGLISWQQSARWWNKNVEELPDITLFGPGTLSLTYDARLRRTNKPGRVYVTRVTFPHPLNAGDRATFTILKRHRVDFAEVVHEGLRDWCGLLGTTTKVEKAVVNARFPKGITPKTVWHFEDLPEWAVPGVASEDNTVTIDGSGFISHAWEELLLGHSYGLAWIW